MIKISSPLGLWIIEAYRRMAAQLQFLSLDDGNLIDSSVVISETTPIDPRMCLVFTDDPSEQKPKCWVSLSNAMFWFDPTGESANSVGFPNGTWRSFLRIQFSRGNVIFLGEKFTTS